MSIEYKAISALKWATIAKLVVQIASWAGTLVIVRLLAPQDYGLMAKVAVVCAIVGAVAELGLGAAIVRSIDMTRENLRKIYGVSLFLGVCTTTVLALMAPLLARLFREPGLAWPIAIASLQIIIAAAALVPNALATRELSYALLSKIEIAAGITSIATTLLLALMGAGVWALVLGTLCGAVVRSTGLLVFGERVRPMFSSRGIGDYLRFGLTVAGNRVSYFLVVQSDVLIGSAFLSTTEIGQYAVALQLATLPMTKVMGTINEIAMPAVAQQQRDLPQVRATVLRALGFISLIAFPVLWGISATAPELVLVLLGSKWLSAVPALVILPLVIPLRMVCGVLFTVSLALGNRRLDLRNTIVTFAFLPTGFFVGAHWGLVGLCVSWLVSVPAAYAFTMPALLRGLDIRVRELVHECGPPPLAAMAMYAVIWALRPAVAGQSPLLALMALVGAGALTYVGTIALFSRRHLEGARTFVRLLRGGKAPEVV